MIKFQCSNCKQKLGVPDDYAGRKVRCNKCNQSLVVPKPMIEIQPQTAAPKPAVNTPIAASGLNIQAPLPPKQDLDELRLEPEDDLPPMDANLEALRQASRQRAEREEAAIPPQLSSRFSPTDVASPPWYWAFTFPLNGTGLGMIGLFVFCRLFLWGVIHVIIYLPGGPFLALVAAIISFIFQAYSCWYGCLCVQLAADGQIKAPDTLQHDDGGAVELIKQMLLIIFAAAVCFLPAIFYSYRLRFAHDGQLTPDGLLWSFIAGGFFFLPMVLLSTILHGTVSGLNPFLIVMSILRAHIRYLLLLAWLSIPFGLFVLTSSLSDKLGIAFALPAMALTLYAYYVGAAMLGRFYYINQDRLDWGF